MKSINNRDCLGPCYDANTFSIHPITLDHITDKKNKYCAVEEYYDEKSKKNKNTDVCIDSKNKEKKIKEIDLNRQFLDCEKFLKIYYKIYSFEEGVNWIYENKYSPVLTRIRIIECCWQVFGKDFNLIDMRVPELYVEVIKKIYMNQIYNNLNNYIKIENNKIYFGKKEQENNNNKKKEKIKFLEEKLINKEEINKFLIKYTDKYRERLDNTNEVILDLIIYLENKIKLII
jgi:hypothetical protein